MRGVVGHGGMRWSRHCGVRRSGELTDSNFSHTKSSHIQPNSVTPNQVQPSLANPSQAQPTQAGARWGEVGQSGMQRGESDWGGAAVMRWGAAVR